MHRFKTCLIVGAAAALAITTSAAPASAAVSKGAIAVVNGIPGTKVDICINGREIKSRVKYGRRAFKLMTPGSKTLKVFKVDPRRCRGTKLGQKRFTLAANQRNTPDGDLTIIVTKRRPKVVIFENGEYGQIPPTGDPLGYGIIFWRHAADLGPVDFRVRRWRPDPEFPLRPAADPFTKGDENFAAGGVPDPIWQVRATRVGETDSIAGPTKVAVADEHRYEVILLGTRPRNAKFVVLDRIVSGYVP
jgi:hypothetical protein